MVQLEHVSHKGRQGKPEAFVLVLSELRSRSLLGGVGVTDFCGDSGCSSSSSSSSSSSRLLLTMVTAAFASTATATSNTVVVSIPQQLRIGIARGDL